MTFRPLLLTLPLLCLFGCTEEGLPGDGSGGTSAVDGDGAGGGTGGESAADGGEGGAGTVPPEAAFTLLFRDDFESFDSSRWQIMTHSWGSNLALFSENSVSTADGFLELALLPATEGTVDDQGNPKQFFGAEVRSTATLTYGKVRARAKLARGSAVVSSLVTIYTPWPADDWNELDIECLGQEPANIQFNAMVYTGPTPTPPVTASVTPTQDPFKVQLGFDPSEDFHVYEIQWSPSGAFFSVDDELLHSWTKNIAEMTLAQNVLLTIWASSETAWAGAVTAETGQAFASYDWVELYEYSP